MNVFARIKRLWRAVVHAWRMIDAEAGFKAGEKHIAEMGLDLAESMYERCHELPPDAWDNGYKMALVKHRAMTLPDGFTAHLYNSEGAELGHFDSYGVFYAKNDD